MEKFLSAVEKITLEQIRHYTFIPSGRDLWMVGGMERDYLIYPERYCSCMNFYMEGVVKNTRYLCKHLLAQQIFIRLDDERVIRAEITLGDWEYPALLKKAEIV
jgi:predicted nucleic acid-binding Zn finger protein